jgi:PIN domain nuclease of toxin-antitoxin system
LKGYLFDTSIVILAVNTPERLSASARKALNRGPGYLSVIAYWEVVIKSKKGALDVGDPRQWWLETLDALALQPLTFRPDHVSAIYDLPPIHQDPFDRALIAQAIVEDLTLVATDRRIAQYACERLRVMP